MGEKLSFSLGGKKRENEMQEMDGTKREATREQIKCGI
jgi:hypothetical protein